ncbi:hypothetical protein [Streptomyces vastus]|uniref:Secreted protein n=1 Tax=Streptomyces vastus TaxID=285451 RepID=A0ABN3QB63_9ACTN
MPRPTAAQLAYGSCTVIFSTLAMLLLSQTSSGPGVAVIALSALALGLLVAMTVPVPKKPTPVAASVAPERVAESVPVTESVPVASGSKR